jgi:hypothetical protein
MDQLGEPITINKKFIKMIEEVIKPHYKLILQELWNQIQKDINKKYEMDVLRSPQNIE